ncbi:MAG: DUF87 domain-containing protein [Syntrophorhabdaceae bacterium]|nr:DUF87 domain-containing protein [Syntrophorhabdaceae bacterium]
MSDEEFKGLKYLTQKQRLAALALNICIFIALSVFVTGEAFPSDSGKRLWLLSGLGFAFLTLLSAPWFRPPRNALVNAVTSALLLSTVDFAGIQMLKIPLDIFRWSMVGVAVATGICAILAIVFIDVDGTEHPHKKQAAILGYRISDIFGKGELIFTPPALISILGYYQQAPVQQLWLFFGWVFVVTIKPVELTLRLIEELKGVARTSHGSEVLGDITRVDNPNIIRVALTSSEKWQPNTVAVACLPNGNQVNVLCLFSHIEESQLVGTGLCHDTTKSPIEGFMPGKVYRQVENLDATRIINDLCGFDGGASLVGFVVEDSTISMIKFEVSSNIQIEEGILIFCRQDRQIVFYQILDAKTAEESFGRNPRGKHIVSAVQLGYLDSAKGFVKYGWLPAMNSPVFIPKEPFTFDITSPRDEEFIIGKVPGSQIAVRASFFEILEYHTAILGVTGTGKTELAFDIIRQALSLDTKVFCVDFTNEYKARLADSNPQLLGLDQKHAEELDQKFFAVETGTYGAPQEKKNLKEFVDSIKGPVKKNVETFLSSEGSSLGIFELPEITNTKATLRATELYLSSIMEWARNNRRARRVLIVLEEAHTIIPETVGSGFDYDTQWIVGRISQIALQGRKYGVGLLMVSQRTALVSKSILSQCNTYITFSLVDKTSLDYLANVYSSVHVQSIPNLRFLEAIAYGKAIRSERPILIKLDYIDAKKAASDALSMASKDEKKE